MQIDVFIETCESSKVRTRYNEITFEKKESFQVNNPYPYDYGFIVGTNSRQDDCLDCYVVGKTKQKEGTKIRCTVIGMVEMLEDKETDNKVIVIPCEDDSEIDLDLVIGNIKKHIRKVFEKFPEMDIEFGTFHGSLETEEFIKKCM